MRRLKPSSYKISPLEQPTITNNKVFLKFRSKHNVRSVSFVNSKLTETSEVLDNVSKAENKKLNFHKRMVTTFEGFIQQLDELFHSMRTEGNSKSDVYIPEFTSYQDICEKLRIEVLIAIDKLELTSYKGTSFDECDIEFLNKMNNLKYQLEDIRCQYHNAIKHFDFKIPQVKKT